MNLLNDEVPDSTERVSLPLRLSNFLFLQGPSCPFFSWLAAALRDRGHRVCRINFNGGDRAFWRLPDAVDYLGDEGNFSAFVIRHFAEHSITDLVLLGDCRPLHKIAITASRIFGVRTHIFEEGYVRPNWITLEHSGVNGFSELPRDINAFLRAASRLPVEPCAVEVPSSFFRRATDDVIYSTATLLLGWRYSRYKRHWPYGQMAEYFHGGRRLISRMIKSRRHERGIAEITTGTAAYYVFPMQVDVDSQIIFHSPFNGQTEVIKLVLMSFSQRAPKDSILVITEHPLETSPCNWRKLVTECALALGIGSRVKFFPGGSPTELLAKSRGIIVVNSTTGHHGLELGVPVIALSRAVFNLDELSFQAGLDKFWTESRPTEAYKVDAYRRVVIHRTQINGGFFSRQGIKQAVANAVPHLEASRDDDAVPARIENSLYSRPGTRRAEDFQNIPDINPNSCVQENFT